MVKLRRLAWAGVEICAGAHSAVIDFVESFPADRLGESLTQAQRAEVLRAEIPSSPPAGSTTLGLLTHFHGDHADIVALGRALRPDGLVVHPPTVHGDELEATLVAGPQGALKESGLAAHSVSPWETVRAGPFTVTALPAADGFGDPQVSYSVDVDGCRIVHAGDTLFHGWWWLSARRQGPFDVALLPIGGAVVDLPQRQPPSPLPAGMDPMQAAIAAKLMGAREVVPIHYGALHRAANYAQVDDPPGAFRAAAERVGVSARVLDPGERLEVARAAS